MLGKSLQTRDRPETLFRVYTCAWKCSSSRYGFLRLEDVASVAPSIKVQRLHMSTQVSLRPVPVAELCGPGMTCFHVRLPSGAGGQVYLSWLYLPYGQVCDDRLRFDPLDRSMWP